MSDLFFVSVLNMATFETSTERFKTAYRANKRVEEINASKSGLQAIYVGDCRTRIFYRQHAARVREVLAEVVRELENAKFRQTQSGLSRTGAL